MINILYDGIKYRIKGSRRVKYLIKKVIRCEKRIPGDLNFVITNDKAIRNINIKFLSRNYYTDVITFDYSKKKIVNGEVYISIDTVRKNALKYKVSLYSELLRVIIHGTLHLCGYDDKTDDERNIIRDKEEKWMKELD